MVKVRNCFLVQKVAADKSALRKIPENVSDIVALALDAFHYFFFDIKKMDSDEDIVRSHVG